MNIKRLYHRILGIALLCGTLAPTLCSCEDEDTYAKMRERENSQIFNFLQRGTRVVNDEGEVLLDVPGPIKVISESQFYANDSTTNVAENEYVLLGGSGVYMQIVREGVGKRLENGETGVPVVCRHLEFNIAADTIQSTNTQSSSTEIYPDRMIVQKSLGVITAYFTSGIFMNLYGETTVPSGWILPLQFIKLGRQSSEDGEVAKVRIIVPSTEGQSDAMSNVYPCFYEITYTRGR
jgi:hypothetical protein